MKNETSTRTSSAGTFDGTQSVGRLRGRLFELLTLGSTVFGLLMVAFLLVYVFNDALRPFSADTGWHLVVFATVVAPSLGLAAYYYARDPPAGEVAVASVGIPLVGLVTGAGIAVLFIEIVTPAEWTGLLLGLGAGVGTISAHRRLRPDAALERLFVVLIAPAVATVGVPQLSVDATVRTPLTGTELFDVAFSTPKLLPGVPELFGSLPILPVEWVLLIGSVTVPVAVLFGRSISVRRDDGRGFVECVVASVAVVTAGVFLAPQMGLDAENWVVLATATLIPTGTYLESVIRRRVGISGLAFPVVLVAGVVIAALLVRTFGFAGPNPWLDWGFLTSPTSRTPEKAGIYPPLVGSVMMLVVIIVAVFPVGVGAAIYLEEYAPDTGVAGRVVDLIEINIGNLAGVPSVVYGLLGLSLFIKGMGLRSGIVIVGGLTVGLLILPIVIISAQEAIRAVPDSLRKASYGMGATRWQTTRNVVLPRALPGILTGTILALGRAIGETAPLLMIGAASSVRLAPNGFFDKFSAMPRQIFAWSSEFDADFRFGVLAAGVVTLLVVLLLMNGTAIIIRNKYQRGD
ncbi:ABC-type phosphate transport system, permease component [Halanaeroarchaeum sp. HSR-CO]|uniref:phosphate ABC transporter permease PstA n=1 Tax=Halanaeroarchaeum sp. HSR-CO TaxID=2866382 RepID=UPI00217CDB2F|nr:phosphate ABC transporter permease PstA [Halanaeroarchaeum sp. HSR-CO]UWG46347.1 ABC-type phosphate transport system, permease component [Halanaeroarchaeum sp. HSR-CO]